MSTAKAPRTPRGKGQEVFLLENILASSSLAPWRLGGSNLELVVGMRVLK